MKKIKLHYKLSNLAEKDIDQIFDYTFSEYGLEQAVKYTTGFHQVFKHLLWNPTLGSLRHEIKPKIYSLTKDRHVIFYIIEKEDITLLRILHGSSDLPKYFK